MQEALPVRYVLKDRFMISGIFQEDSEGICYEAWDHLLARQVIIREWMPAGDCIRQKDGITVLPAEGREEIFWEKTQKFCEKANQFIRHQEWIGILPVYSLFQENGTFYYVREYREGFILKVLLEQAELIDHKRKKQIFEQCMLIVEALHEWGSSHGMIDAAHIFVEGGGSVNLVDMGYGNCSLEEEQKNLCRAFGFDGEGDAVTPVKNSIWGRIFGGRKKT